MNLMFLFLFVFCLFVFSTPKFGELSLGKVARNPTFLDANANAWITIGGELVNVSGIIASSVSAARNMV